ncbi:transposase [Streptomyces canus]|uniref:transposase n=1 Tax=Streptomyces canus TaxID=58343 RepID=UPI0036E3AA94
MEALTSLAYAYRVRTRRSGPTSGRPPGRPRTARPCPCPRRGPAHASAALTDVAAGRDVGEVVAATAVSSADSQALPGIHARLRRLRLLPDRHLVDGGYTSVAGMDAAARLHRVTLIGPLPPSTTPQHRANDGFGRENFIIDFDQREVTCPNGQVSDNWQDLPVDEPTKVTVRFDIRQCGRCPERAKCTPGPFRSLYFPTSRLHELQTKNRADQQDADWRRFYGRRSEVEDTVEEFADGHRGRRCRYRGLAKTHVQHVLTALVINVERLSLQEPADGSYRPRPPTAFQPRRKRLTPAAVVAPREVTPVLKIPDRVKPRACCESGLVARRAAGRRSVRALACRPEALVLGVPGLPGGAASGGVHSGRACRASRGRGRFRNRP